MPRLPLIVLPLAAALAGCATNSAAIPAATPGSPALSTVSLAAPVEAPAPAALPPSAATAWHEVDPATMTAPSMSTSTSPPVASGQVGTHLTALVGERWLDSDEWGDFDQPVAYGLEVDGSNSEGHGYEVGVMYTDEKEDDLGNITALDGETTTWEAYLGYRYTFNQDGTLHPFLSVGGGAENGEFEASTPFGSDSDDDTVFGGYARAGLLWDLGDHVRLGLDYRHFWGQDLEVNVAGADITANSDYDQVMATLGWGF